MNPDLSGLAEVVIGDNAATITDKINLPGPSVLTGSTTNRLNDTKKLEINEKLKDGTYVLSFNEQHLCFNRHKSSLLYKFGRILDQDRTILPFICCKFCGAIYFHAVGTKVGSLSKHKCSESMNYLDLANRVDFLRQAHFKTTFPALLSKSAISKSKAQFDTFDLLKKRRLLQKELLEVQLQYNKAEQLRALMEARKTHFEQIKQLMCHT